MVARCSSRPCRFTSASPPLGVKQRDFCACRSTATFHATRARWRVSGNPNANQSPRRFHLIMKRAPEPLLINIINVSGHPKPPLRILFSCSSPQPLSHSLSLSCKARVPQECEILFCTCIKELRKSPLCPAPRAAVRLWLAAPCRIVSHRAFWHLYPFNFSLSLFFLSPPRFFLITFITVLLRRLFFLFSTLSHSFLKALFCEIDVRSLLVHIKNFIPYSSTPLTTANYIHRTRF